MTTQSSTLIPLHEFRNLARASITDTVRASLRGRSTLGNPFFIPSQCGAATAVLFAALDPLICHGHFIDTVLADFRRATTGDQPENSAVSPFFRANGMTTTELSIMVPLLCDRITTDIHYRLCDAVNELGDITHFLIIDPDRPGYTSPEDRP